MSDPEFDGVPSVELRVLTSRPRQGRIGKIHVGAAFLAAVLGVVVLAKPHASDAGHHRASAKSARFAPATAALEPEVFSARFEGTTVVASASTRKARLVLAASTSKKGNRVDHSAFAALPETAQLPESRPGVAVAESSAESAVIAAAIDNAFAETPAVGAPVPAHRPAELATRVEKAAPANDVAPPKAFAEAAKPAKPVVVAAEKPEKPAGAERKRSLGDVVLASLGGTAPAKPKPAKTVESRAKAFKPAPLLGYAANEDPSAGGVANSVDKFFSRPASVSASGKRVAIYDVSAAKVYLPNGQTLEAHSGLGHMKDNPRYVAQKMNGPTPPDVYKLSMREKRFHGVAAIRMTPVDGRAKHGRTGFLAHTALVRGTNGSHGCVAFKDYQTFLKAFKAGKITHMVVVNRKSDAPKYLASL